MNILYLSHCAPDLPDKGEKIRAHHFLTRLAARHRVHLACLSRTPEETARTLALAPSLASVFVSQLSHKSALARAAVRYALGRSLTVEYYRHGGLARHLAAASWTNDLDAVLVYSAAMAAHAPPGVPLVLDLCDLDSEKWFEYDRLRCLPLLYRLEGQRLRKFEQSACARAAATILMTGNEAALVRQSIPAARIEIIANGVDFNYWTPAPAPAAANPSLAFVGQLDYFPNSSGAIWFARDIFPTLRAAIPALEFVIAGRNPGRGVLSLASLPGVRVIASPPDVRPIIAAASAVVAPLTLARGLQNKVLEALAMGKRVLATPQLALTFGQDLPPGISVCDTPAQYLAAAHSPTLSPNELSAVLTHLRQNFCWDSAANRLISVMEHASAPPSM
ncbi:MAG: sugar transferase [Candidatus Solibacter sp.]|nr:sugar transferase [Candidatus Solibacter sp.]